MHITYDDKIDAGCLHQGDVLRRTDAVDAFLGEIHPHYLKEDYKYLIVLTQGCDLVRRYGDGKACKARYISVAAVRPLHLVIERELAKHRRHPLEHSHRLCDESYREGVREFMQRLLNNNEPEYFYLHSEPSAAFAEAHCAFLTLSIAIKSDLHYDTCLAAKVLQLRESFQHKLGWLTGNLYSRVGTDDWVPGVCSSQNEFEGRIEETLQKLCVWIDPGLKAKLYKRLKELPDLTTEIALKEYQVLQQAHPKKKDKLVARFRELMIEQGVDPLVAKRVANMVNSDQDLAGCFAK